MGECSRVLSVMGVIEVFKCLSGRTIPMVNVLHTQKELLSTMSNNRSDQLTSRPAECPNPDASILLRNIIELNICAPGIDKNVTQRFSEFKLF